MNASPPAELLRLRAHWSEANTIVSQDRGSMARRIAAFEAETAWREAQAAARVAFAAERGWLIAKHPFTVDQLKRGSHVRRRCEGFESSSVLDHRDCFRLGRQRPVAILSHTYAGWPACLAFAAEHGLHVEQLPWSWYYPGGCTPALFTRVDFASTIAAQAAKVTGDV